MQVYFSWQPVDIYQLEAMNVKERFSFITLLRINFCPYNSFKCKNTIRSIWKGEHNFFEKWSILGCADTLSDILRSDMNRTTILLRFLFVDKVLSINQSIDQSINRSIDQSINQSINTLIERLIDRSDQSIDQGGKGVVRDAWFEQKFARDAWNQPKSGRDPWIIALTWRVIGLVWGPWYVIRAEIHVKIKILVNPFIKKTNQNW